MVDCAMSAVYMSFLEGMTPECGVIYVKEMLVKVEENNIDSLVLKAFTLGHMAIIQLFLLDARTNPRFNDDCCFRAALAKNHFKLVVFMIKQFPDIDPSRDGNLALRNAVIAGFYNLARELLADPRVRATSVAMAVYSCIKGGDGTMMNVFLESRIITNETKCQNLSLCSYLGKTNCVASLLQHDVSANWNCGEPIRKASEENRCDCLLLLLNAGTTNIDLPITNGIGPDDKTYTVGEYALLEAVKRNHYNVVRLLLEFTAVTQSLQEPFFAAIQSRNARLVELFLQMPRLTLSESTNVHDHALMLAVKYENTQVLYEILRDIRMTHPDQAQVYVSALGFAIKKPNHDVLLTLLEQPPDSVSIDETHCRLMGECVKTDKMGALKILLGHNALAMAFDDYAVVSFAVGKKSTRAVQLFLDCPAIQPFVERAFPVILRVAIMKESLPLVRMILLDGRVHPRNQELDIAVDNCSEGDRLDILRALCEVMTSPEIPDNFTVCTAIFNKKYDAVACLREYFDLSNRGVLTYTAELGDVEMVRSLLQDNRFRAELEPQSLAAACTAESWQNAREIVVDLLGRLDPAFDGSACLTAACARMEISEAYELVQLFIDDGRAKIAHHTDNHPAMLMAIDLGRSSLVNLFVELGQVHSYANYLQAAVFANQLDVVQLLFDKCTPDELSTHEVRNALVTALEVALVTGDTRMFDWLSSTGFFDLNNDEFPDALHDTWVNAIGLNPSNPTRAIVMGLVKRIATKYIRVCLRTTQHNGLNGEPGLSAKILAYRYRNMIKPNLNTREERQLATEATLGALFKAAQRQEQEQANAAAAANVEAESIAAAAAARDANANANANAQSRRPIYGERSFKRLS